MTEQPRIPRSHRFEGEVGRELPRALQFQPATAKGEFGPPRNIVAIKDHLVGIDSKSDLHVETLGRLPYPGRDSNPYEALASGGFKASIAAFSRVHVVGRYR